MLGEYISRFDYTTGEPHDDLVECFYPDETTDLNHFKSLIKQYEMETSQVFQLSEKTGPQGHVYLYSSSLSRLINSYYKLDKNKLATLDRNIFQNLNNNFKYAFLRGVYYRFGSGNEITIANGINKLRIVALVMKTLNVNDIKLYGTIGDSTPIAYVLTFGISDSLVKELVLSDVISTIDFKNYRQIDLK
jgi:hypothetical protein